MANGKNTATAKSNQPPSAIDEGPALLDLKKAFAHEMESEQIVEAARTATSVLALQYGLHHPDVMSEWDNTWDALKTTGRGKDVQTIKTNARDFVALQFGITPAVQGNEDSEDKYDLAIKRALVHFEMCVQITRHEGYSFGDFVFRGDSTFIKRDTALGTELWSELGHDKANATKDASPAYEMRIVQRNDQAKAGM